MANDRRYYFRHNFNAEPMEHYQVADLFGRRKSPVLELECLLTYAGSGPSGQSIRLILSGQIVNVGRSVAKNWLLLIRSTGMGLSVERTRVDANFWNYQKPTGKEEHAFSKKEILDFIYPGLPYPISPLDFIVQPEGSINLEFTIVAEDMELFEDNWLEVKYEDFPHSMFGKGITRTVFKKV